MDYGQTEVRKDLWRSLVQPCSRKLTSDSDWVVQGPVWLRPENLLLSVARLACERKPRSSLFLHLFGDPGTPLRQFCEQHGVCC